MGEELTIRIIGTPKAQPRPRAFARIIKLADGRKVPTARVHEAGTAEAWKSEIAAEVEKRRPAIPLSGPLRIDITFLFPRSNAYLRSSRRPDGRMLHDVKPDRDNLDKAVLDCLKLMRYYEDDGQVCDGRIRKLYVARNELSGAEIVIRPATLDDLAESQIPRSWFIRDAKLGEIEFTIDYPATKKADRDREETLFPATPENGDWI